MWLLHQIEESMVNTNNNDMIIKNHIGKKNYRIHEILKIYGKIYLFIYSEIIYCYCNQEHF